MNLREINFNLNSLSLLALFYLEASFAWSFFGGTGGGGGGGGGKGGALISPGLFNSSIVGGTGGGGGAFIKTIDGGGGGGGGTFLCDCEIATAEIIKQPAKKPGFKIVIINIFFTKTQ